MRKPIIAGNWKMNKTIKEAMEFVEDIKGKAERDDVETVICAPYIILKDLVEATKGTKIKIGAENMHFEDSGAFTGEISVNLLKEIGVDYCIIGHSERRQYYNETDESVNKKIKKALANNIIPILCVGETLEEKEQGKTNDKVKGQTEKAFDGLSKDEAKKVVVAYEPIWAIGTGKTATADDANAVIGYIRSVIEGVYGKEVSDEVVIQYGGSVKPGNVKELMGKEHIDGALVGGASLKPDDFIKLVNYKEQ